MAYLDHIRACNNFDPKGYRPFRIAGERYGWIGADVADHLADWPKTFLISDDAVTLAPHLADFDSRSAAVAEPITALTEANYIEAWRGEFYPVTRDWHTPPAMQMERAACPYFGLRAYGVHLNGFVRKPDGIHMWVARRCKTKQTYPGLLDNMVAGGQPIGLGLMENLIKEADEEAGVPAAVAKTAIPVGLISYTHLMPEQPKGGVKPDHMFCYDLEVPEDFTPVPVDGEVESFHLWPIEQVAEIVRSGFEFKFNCNLVVIDFLLRHGIIGPDNEPDYAALAHGLRAGD
jgi:isopentenyldiphosphate isomerase